jgi:hypothetical protein
VLDGLGQDAARVVPRDAHRISFGMGCWIWANLRF